ncbi:MAG: radical SAM family heme chaperone HemW [Candidatus Amoebophilus sp.]
MAGIYIHIPFCKQACHYCDFHFSTNMRQKSEMLAAIQQELSLQKDYLNQAEINSIYLGGGTPSLLEAEEIAALLIDIRQIFTCKEGLEITLEANPDDIDLKKLLALRTIGINRLSIGIQTFHNNLLQYLNRAHDSTKATQSLEIALQAGFNNFNLDLIYAIPDQTEEMLRRDLLTALQFKPTHISAYCLTIEQKTVFGHWLKTGKIKAVDEEIAAKHFHLLVNTLTGSNYKHYEVSNFSLPHYHAQHNTNYWKRGSYLGVGPGAHSYNGTSRQYNIANNTHYIQSVQAGVVPSTIEILRPQDHINEYIMTSLRTEWGCDIALLKNNYQYDLRAKHLPYLEQLINRQLAYIKGNILVLTTEGKLLADKISVDLFVA